MNSKTIVIASVVIATIAALAIAPLAYSPAMAVRSGGSTTTTVCVHNGSGEVTSNTPPNCGPGESEQPVTQTQYKCQGKFQATPCPPKPNQ